MNLSVTTLAAGSTLQQLRHETGLSLPVLKELTNLAGPADRLVNDLPVVNLEALIGAEKVDFKPMSSVASATTASAFSPAAGGLVEHAVHGEFDTPAPVSDISLEHENRGVAGDLAAGEVRPPSTMKASLEGVSQYSEALKDSFWIPEGLFIVPMGNSPDDPAVSVDEARVPPGVTTALHKVAVDERYYILSGSGIAEVGGEARRVLPGDIVNYPAGTPERITNDGDEMLRFLCICSARFVPDDYGHLEDAKVPYESYQQIAPGSESDELEQPDTFHLLATEGNGILEIAGRMIPILAGELVTIEGGTSHRLLCGKGDKPLTVWRSVSVGDDEATP